MADKLIGRSMEQEELLDLFHSGRPEFVAVFGRRRVGKTFLVNSLFKKEYAFKLTAVLDNNKSEQLRNFADALSEFGQKDVQIPTDWFSAFKQLRELLENSNRKRKVVFIDEMPWLDTKRSRFIPALEHFWNSWASTQDDIMLIICGSAASWIVKKIFRNRGGLYNRVTRRIFLQPFTLAECRNYAEQTGLPFDAMSLLESYMVFGGIPYYLSLLNRKWSFAQNVNNLCFVQNGQLRNEFESLFASLFRNAARHLLVVEALGKKKVGLTREEILKATKLADNGSLSETLEDLELCGFIRKYTPVARKQTGSLDQLLDHSTLFNYAFIKGSPDEDPDYWMKKRTTPAFNTWRGFAFEQVCLSHVRQIQKAIGLSGIITHVESWKSEQSDPGAQIDLLINRSDNVISLCEMRFSSIELTLTKKLALELTHRKNVFVEETMTKKGVHIALVTPIGLKRNEYYDLVQSVVTLDDLLSS